jgi:flagella basal body P-ring formation protein FlgA
VTTRRSRVVAFALAGVVLALAMEAGAQAPRVAVAAREIARGTSLSPADIGYASTAVRAPEATASIDAAAADDSLVGWTTRRLIAAGEPLKSPAVAPPVLVKANAFVDVIYQDGGITITARGRASRAASLGERLTIRLDAQRKVEAIVIAAGRVRVN